MKLRAPIMFLSLEIIYKREGRFNQVQQKPLFHGGHTSSDVSKFCTHKQKSKQIYKTIVKELNFIGVKNGTTLALKLFAEPQITDAIYKLTRNHGYFTTHQVHNL